MAGILNIVKNDAVINGNNVTIQDIFFATTSEIDLYVRAADGSDSNPGSSSLPLATLVEAESRIPLNVNHTIRIHVGPHSGSGYTIPHFRPRILNANIWVIGDGGGGVTDGFTEIVGSSVAQSGSTDLLLRTSGGLSSSEYYGFGEHFGRTIEILTGAAAGDRRTIRNNDTTDIYPTLPFSASISSGDTYRILEPEAIMYFTSDGSKLVSGCGQSSVITDQSQANRIGFVNFKFDAASSIILNAEYSSIVLYGIMTTKRITLDCYASTINSGLEINGVTSVSSPGPVSDLGVSSNLNWIGWGISARGTGSAGQVWIWRGYFQGTINAGGISSSLGPTIIINGGSLVGDYIPGLIIYDHTNCIVYGALQEILFGTLTSPNHMIDVRQSYLRFNCYMANAVHIQSNSDGLQVKDGGNCVFFSTVSSGIRFTTNSVGMEVEQHGTIDLGSNRPVMTCSGGDISVDNEATTYSIGSLGTGKLLTELGFGTIRG